MLIDLDTLIIISPKIDAPSLGIRPLCHGHICIPMCSRWVFWRNRPAALGCPAGRRVKIRRRESHRELLTRSYNFPDVGSLLGHRINILRWPAGGRPAIGDILRRPDWYRIDRANPEYLRHPADARPMICRRLADYLASDATLWHIGRPDAGVMPARRRI